MPLKRYVGSVDYYGDSEEGFLGRQHLFGREIEIPGTFANATNALKAAAQKLWAPPDGTDEVKLIVRVVHQ